jgi:hypothetical protein
LSPPPTNFGLARLGGLFHVTVINERAFQRWWLALREPFADQKEAARSAWQAAIEHERTACELVCEEIASTHRARYQGCADMVDRYAMYNPHAQGLSDGASDCADAIRARNVSS